MKTGWHAASQEEIVGFSPAGCPTNDKSLKEFS